MANINVTELLTDPDFTDVVEVIRRKSTVNTLGENVIAELRVKTIGSVQPASGKALQRLPEALRVANVSSFWIKIGINTEASLCYPDVLVFRGKRYQVQNVLDWGNWGEGWAEGTCIAEKPSG